MKKTLSFLLLASTYLSFSFAQTPLSLPGIKNVITGKLTVVGSDRVTAEKMRDVTNTLADQISTKTTFTSVSGLRSLSISSASALPIVTLTDALRGGSFRLTPGNIDPDDGALTIVDQAGNRYKRILPENRLTPQMFGAIPDDNVDDWAALKAWINYSGNFEHFLPAGTYICSDSLVRTNKKGFVLRGAGNSRSIIQFSGNSDGLKIKNILNQKAYGPISIYGIELQSTGTKTGAKIGLYINSEHEQYPGPAVSDVVIRVVGATTNQWITGLQYHNTSHSNTDRIAIYGVAQNFMTGMIFSSDGQRSSVEHNVTNWTIFNVKRAVLLDSPLSTPQGHGNEGIQFTNGSAYALLEGFRGVVTNRAPMIGFTNVHVATQGGYAMHLDGYTDLSFHGVELQVYTSPSGVIPPYALHLGNITFATGDIRVFLRGNLPVGAELKGVSGGINLNIAGSYNSAQTYFIKQDSDCDAIIDAGGIWTKDPTTFADWGSVPHPPLTVVGGGVGRQPVSSGVTQAKEGDVLRYSENSKYVYEPVKPHVTDIASYTTVGGGISTVSMANYDVIFVTGSASTTLVIDRSKAPLGKKITIVRYDEGSTGSVFIRSDSPTFNLFQDVDAFFKSSIMMPAGIHPQTWTYIGVFKLIAGGNSLPPLNNLADVSSVPTSRGKLQVGTPGTDANRDLLLYNNSTSAWEPANARNAMASSLTFVSTSTTIDPNVHDLVLITGAGNMTLMVDYTKFTRAGQTICFGRYDNSTTGTITLQTTDAANHLVQNGTGNYLPSTTLSATAGSRCACYTYTGMHLFLKSN